ncbi:MAG: tRNA1Val (adenine37-N6)-methyltransferase [Arenicella sp.]|jgi:tRNA1Val (adenine37-N6)-methyltransferase
MTNPFKFKEFEVIQEKNAQKVGTDSMLLGAWSKGNYSRVLDIGTGTGILALMCAQKFKDASVTAIEPDLGSFEEATSNFNNSQFSNRILSINSSLQSFGAIEKFDFIICNPPYFDGTFLSEDLDRNRARHQSQLSTDELYECASDLLSEEGKFNLVIPHSSLTEHLERAFDNDLFLQEILITLSPDGTKKRAFISLGSEDIEPLEKTMMVKDSDNNYSPEYIQMTKKFYLKEL